jgi:magnesium transporter
MARTRELSLAFAETHPSDAARVLEHLPVTDATAFLTLLPARLGAPVLRHMLPTSAARCLEQLDDEAAAGLVHDLDAQAGTAMLRYVSQHRRERLVTQLPTASALAFRLLLTYPEDTVGAWINPHCLAVTPDTPVNEALERLRQSAESAVTYLFVVNAEQRLQGIAVITDLLRAGRGTTVAQVMRPPGQHLSARASLSAARDSEGWQEFHALPVVERQERFIGALEFPVLCRALEQPRHGDTAPPTPDGIALLARSGWLMFASLLQALVTLLPTRTVENKRHAR